MSFSAFWAFLFSRSKKVLKETKAAKEICRFTDVLLLILAHALSRHAGFPLENTMLENDKDYYCSPAALCKRVVADLYFPSNIRVPKEQGKFHGHAGTSAGARRSGNFQVENTYYWQTHNLKNISATSSSTRLPVLL